MELNNKLTVSASPHVKSAETTTGIMLDVIIALIPAGVASIFVFGLKALAVIAVSVAACVLAEFLSRKAMKREQTIGDLSAVVTGLLLAYNLPATMPLWEVALGAVIAIVVVKQMFGGIGQNFVNPALLARIVLMSAFPARMSAGAMAGTNITGWDVEAATGATPMGMISLADGLKDGAPSLMDMFIGTTSGCLGEVSALALMLGGLYLIIRKVISPIIPVAYIGTVAIITLIAFGDVNAMLYEVLGGGLMIGAIFMATDYTTSPITNKGKWIYAICAGLLTCLIRLFGSLPEGVSFSIIIMNILVPHIENATKPTIFGTVKEKKNKEADA
ncbi:MAG: RnfABCDGE type electron transport complex subunit D [Oscillospiraceae bacterium]|nr:RnfABCDGE type electron transport complex subunit D [Candidatus Limimonas coprohippi]MCQ2488606.1 RnfABCDGE type electron transport complex subunit D [Clostridia bacterium]